MNTTEKVSGHISAGNLTHIFDNDPTNISSKNGTLDKRSEAAFYFKGMLDIGQNILSSVTNMYQICDK